MANKKISELDSGSVPTDLDVIPMLDYDSLSTKGVRASHLAAYVTGSITNLNLNTLSASNITSTSITASYLQVSGVFSSSVKSGNAIVLPMNARIYWGNPGNTSYMHGGTTNQITFGQNIAVNTVIASVGYQVPGGGNFNALVQGPQINDPLLIGRSHNAQVNVGTAYIQGGAGQATNIFGGSVVIRGGTGGDVTARGGSIYFQTAETGSGTTLRNRMMITSSGEIGIGTDNPAEKLHVSGGNILVNGAITASYISSSGRFTSGVPTGQDAISLATGARINFGGPGSSQYMYGVSSNQITVNAARFVASSMYASSYSTANGTDALWLQQGASPNDVVLTSRTGANLGVIGTTYVRGGVSTGVGVNGRDAYIQGGTAGDAAAIGGVIRFQTAASGSGTTYVTRMIVTASGYIGISNDNPTQLLDVNGNVNVNNTLSASIIRFGDGTTQSTAAGVGGSGMQGAGNIHSLAKFNGTASLNSAQISIDPSTNHVTVTGSLSVLSNLTASSALFAEASTHQVGIGAAPTDKLDVTLTIDSIGGIRLKNLSAGANAYTTLYFGNSTSPTDVLVFSVGPGNSAYGGARSGGAGTNTTAPFIFICNGVEQARVTTSGLSTSRGLTASNITSHDPHVNIQGGLKIDGPLYGYSSAYTTLTASHTLSNGDNGRIVILTSLSQSIITVPTNLTGGFGVSFLQAGTGSIMVTGALGVTVFNRQFHKHTAGLHAIASLIYLSGNAYVFAGDTI